MRHEPVYKHMTISPYTVGREQKLSYAKQLMKEHGIRHLPVLDAGVLVGIVSERDIEYASSVTDTDPDRLPIEDAMTPEPYVVAPDADLSVVADAMAKHKYGCAIVVEDGHVAGMFTTVDALRALATLVEANDRH